MMMLEQCMELMDGLEWEWEEDVDEDVEGLLGQADYCKVMHRMWDRIHSGEWKDVEQKWRDLYSFAVLKRFPNMLRECSNVQQEKERLYYDLDCALLFGGNMYREIVLETIEALDDKLIRPLKPRPNDAQSDFENIYSPLPHPVTRISKPPLLLFHHQYVNTSTPCVLLNIIDSCECLWKWRDTAYLRSLIGHRTIPVEVGSHYMVSEWTQKLQTVQEFIDEYYSPLNPVEKGYCAQHDLLGQIPALQCDFTIPDYCFMGGSGQDPKCNIWWGPANTFSPFHFDKSENILCQVIGRKYVCLVSPDFSEFMYPSSDLPNSSSIDLSISEDLSRFHYDQEAFPQFSLVSFHQTILYPGECLYIPAGHWHCVKSLDRSISTSVWW